MTRDERFRRLQELGCIACRKMRKFSAPDIHHLNLGGHAGQKRRGDAFTIPLCPAHHRGVFWREEDHGPSLAIHPGRFRREFGSDDELLAEVNALLGVNDAPAE